MKKWVIILLVCVLSVFSEAIQIRDGVGRKAGSIEIANGVFTYKDKGGTVRGMAEKRDGKIYYKNSAGDLMGWTEEKDNFTTYFDHSGRVIATAETLNQKIYYRNCEKKLIGFSVGRNSITTIYNQDGKKLVTIEAVGALLRPIPLPEADLLFGSKLDFPFESPAKIQDDAEKSSSIPAVKKQTLKSESVAVVKDREAAPAVSEYSPEVALPSESENSKIVKVEAAPVLGKHHVVRVKSVNPNDEGDLAGIEVGDILAVFCSWSMATAEGGASTLLKKVNEVIEENAWNDKEIIVMRKHNDSYVMIPLQLMSGELGITFEAVKVTNDEFYGLVDKIPKQLVN